MTQKEIVIDYFNSNGNKPTHYSKVSEDTGILVDSMRRILGMGVYDNTFIRNESGIYTLNDNSKNLKSFFFEKEKIYNRSQLHDEFGGNRQRGISNCVNYPFILIFSNPDTEQQDVYVDEWKKKYFYYSGEGRVGDMTMTGGNSSILNHENDNKQIHLFEKTESSGYWKYIDQLRLVDINYYRNDDENEKERQSFQFILLSTTEEDDIKVSKNDSGKPKRYNYNRPNTTERRGLVTSRVGQGYYKSRLLDKWNSKCSVTGVGITKILIGSHIVPWRDSNDDERLDVDNGILLTPNLDGLFDKYLITFDDNGKIVFSKKLDINELTILGINNEMKISSVNSRMKNYLKRHREKFYEQEK